MSFGINFRNTSGYVTDSAGETYCITDSYPTTRGGITFGWETSETGRGRDRNSGNDRRLAGINFWPNNNSPADNTFRVDLPAPGTYPVRLAMGDAGSLQELQYFQIKDGSTVLTTIDDTDGTSSNNFDDATGTMYSAANWAASNTAYNAVMTGTALKILIGANKLTGSTTIAHLFVGDASGGGSTPFAAYYQQHYRAQVVS